MLTFRRAIRSLTRRPRYAWGFLIAGVLGLSGNLYLSALEGSIRSSLSGKSRELLTGDISISVRRRFTPEESQKIMGFLGPRSTETTRSIDLYSMMASKKGSRFVQLIAIEENYPLIGRITLEKSGVVEGKTPKRMIGRGKVWVDPDLRDALGLTSGSPVKIGEYPVTVEDVVLDDTANTWRGFALAPRVFITMDDLMATGLIQKGSTLSERYYSILKPDLDAREIAHIWNEYEPDTSIRVIPHQDASEQVARLSGYLNDYLALVGLTTLFLSLIGMSFLFQTELRKRLRMIGTLSVLGDSMGRVALELAVEASLLGLGSAVVSLGLVRSTLPIASRIIEKMAGVSIFPQITPLQVALTLVSGAILGFLLALPFASRVRRLKPSALFQEESNLELPFRRRDAIAVLPLLLVFYALSVQQSHSFRVGSLFFALSLLSMGGLYVIGSMTFRSIEKWVTHRDLGTLPFRLAARSLSRNPWSSLSAFVATGAGAILLSLIPSLQVAMEHEIERPEGSRVPSIFLFDIQEDQVAGLKELITAEGARLDFLSPLVRARLETLNGKTAEKSKDLGERSTREQEEEDRSRNRGYSLSYRAELSESESISAGRNVRGVFDPSSGELPEATVERKFADRLDVGIGDRIGFNVQGVPIEVKVVGLRNVRWSSFQPNFFILLQPGAIDDAPKTYLAGIPALSVEKRRAIQEKLVATFPNISSIQVEDLVRKILRIFDQMGVAVRITGILSLVTGLFVLFAIARRQAAMRRRNALLLKTVGASARDVIGIFLWEFGLLAFSASLLGGLLSLGISRLLVWIVFDRFAGMLSWVEGRAFLLSVTGITVISMATAAFAAWGIARAKPWKLLQAED